jgi:UDP-GlcNAc:undecaprenyl-phosphate GlcNAc-1-phosphate transferase
MLSALRYLSKFGSFNKRKLSIQHMDGYLFGAIVCAAVIVAFMLCRHALAIGTYFNLLDVPGDRKKHKHITPLMGGIVILAAVLPAAFAIITFVTPEAHHTKLLVWSAVVAGMTIIGILDDRHSLSPRVRLLASFAIFGIAAYIEPIFNVRVLDFDYPSFSLGLGTRGIAVAFTVLCCVGLVNAVNMADGKNGLVIGLCIGWLTLLATRAPESFLSLLSLLIAVLLMLLAFNLRSKLFLGDGGSYGLAAAIGLIAIGIYNSPGTHATRAIAAEELMLLLAIPVIDSFRLTFKRIRRGQSPMAADRDHLHHHLQDRFGWPYGLLIYWLVAFSPVLCYFTAMLFK